MKYTLVAILNGSCMMKNLDLCIEVLHTEIVVGVQALNVLRNWVYQARAFSDVVVLNWLSILTDNFNIDTDLT